MSANVVVKPVSTNKDFRSFIRLPWTIYRGDPNWVPPLIMDQKNLLKTQKNPFFQHSEIQHFLASKQGKLVGRISSIINHNYNRFQNEKTGFFGFFESTDDENVSQTLFEAAGGWIREQKMERMRGPANPSTNETLGLLVDAFDRPPMVLMPYNPPYYADLFKKYGLKKAKDLYAFYIEDTIPISDKIKRVAEIIRKKHSVTVRSIDMKKFDKELELIKVIYNNAWSHNWGFFPWTDEEIEHLGKELKPIVNPDLVLLAFVDGEPAGFSLAIPDMNQVLKRINGRLFPFGLIKVLWYARKVNQMRVGVMGVCKQYRTMGIDALFYYETYIRGIHHGITKAELSWILEDNYPMYNALEKWGCKRYKTYRIYDIEFSEKHL